MSETKCRMTELAALGLLTLGLAAHLPAGRARAENGMWNVHGAGVFLPGAIYGVEGAVDWQLARPWALEVGIAGGSVAGDSFLSVMGGGRFRFLDDQSGYLDEPGGSIAGHMWVAPRVGFVTVAEGGALLADTAIGYDFSVVNPVSVGPFARVLLGAGASGPFGGAEVGIGLTLEFEPIRDPVGPDRDVDRDGVGNRLDACPATPRGSRVDERGCVIMVRNLVLEGIEFDFDSAVIQPSSEAVLRNAAYMLRDNPRVRVEIGGHTDDLGDQQYNRDLSSRRAQSVAAWLNNNGVARPRVAVRGYGSSQPRVSNTDEVSRAQNRRIEFRQLDR